MCGRGRGIWEGCVGRGGSVGGEVGDIGKQLFTLNLMDNSCNLFPEVVFLFFTLHSKIL